MSIEIPDNRKEITDRIKNDIRAQLPQSNPFLRNSFIGALAFGLSGRVFDFFLQLQVLETEMFMDTATGQFLERWGSYKNIFRKAATIAEGPITIGGTPGSVIPNGTDFQTQDQTLYTSNGTVEIKDLNRDISILTRIGQIVTVITETPHEYATGLAVIISGADQPEYNGQFTIISTGEDTFTYGIIGTPVTPATGSLKAEFTGITVSLESQDFGQIANQESGTSLTLTTPIAGVDSAGFVQFSTISGGEDLESDEDLRNRIIDRYQNPVSFYNVAQIEQQVKTVAGVTRVLVREAFPLPGDITVFFTKDNDPTIIPTLTDRRLAKAAVLEIKPAHVLAGTVNGSDPTGLIDPASGNVIFPVLRSKVIDFIFTVFVPDSSSLREAVKANLVQLFKEQNPIGSSMSQFLYQCAVFEAFDDTGSKVTDFELSTPNGDIEVDNDEIAVLGNVIFNLT